MSPTAHTLPTSSFLIAAERRITQFNRALGRGLAWLTLGMVVIMAFKVFQRYLFDITHIWQQELVLYLHAITFMGASAWTLHEDGHVRVDIFYCKFSLKTKAWINLFGTVMFLFPLCVSLIYCSRDFVLNAWGLFEASSEYNGLPGVFLIKSLIWVFAATLALQGMALIFSSLSTLKRGE